jgi:hypothetical protein
VSGLNRAPRFSIRGGSRETLAEIRSPLVRDPTIIIPISLALFLFPFPAFLNYFSARIFSALSSLTNFSGANIHSGTRARSIFDPFSGFFGILAAQ